jgi:hypothetical protein
MIFRRSSYSWDNNCVEVADSGFDIAVRDSEDPNGPVLIFSYRDWDAFLKGVRDGEFDPPAAPALPAPVVGISPLRSGPFEVRYETPKAA